MATVYSDDDLFGPAPPVVANPGAISGQKQSTFGNNYSGLTLADVVRAAAQTKSQLESAQSNIINQVPTGFRQGVHDVIADLPQAMHDQFNDMLTLPGTNAVANFGQEVGSTPAFLNAKDKIGAGIEDTFDDVSAPTMDGADAVGSSLASNPLWREFLANGANPISAPLNALAQRIGNSSPWTAARSGVANGADTIIGAIARNPLGRQLMMGNVSPIGPAAAALAQYMFGQKPGPTNPPAPPASALPMATPSVVTPDQLPPPAQRKVGMTVPTPKGNMSWTAQGWVPAGKTY